MIYCVIYYISSCSKTVSVAVPKEDKKKVKSNINKDEILNQDK